jgi:hypothetical protein
MAAGGMFPTRSGLRRSAEGGRWVLQEDPTAHERLIRWHGTRPFPRFSDGHCHLREFRQRMDIDTANGLLGFGASRPHWPRTIVTNYAASTDFCPFQEMAVSCPTLNLTDLTVLFWRPLCLVAGPRLWYRGLPVGPRRPVGFGTATAVGADSGRGRR